MSNDLRVGVAGASGALGKEILDVLDRAPWRPRDVVPLASAATSEQFATWGGDQVAIDVLAEQAMGDLDGLILAVPAAAAEQPAEEALREGLAVVDCSGALAARMRVPVGAPWIRPEALLQPPVLAAAVPSPEALLLAGALGPLARAGIGGPTHATVMVPASASGRQGMAELSGQVVALLNSGTPPRRIFPPGLAFDLLPLEEAVDAEGWQPRERQVMEELRALVDWSETSITQLRVPLFSGMAALVIVQDGGSTPLDLLRRVLQDGGVRMVESESPRTVPRPRRVEGVPFTHAARLRRDATGALHMWLAMDNLRTTAAAAVASMGVLLRDRIEAVD